MGAIKYFLFSKKQLDLRLKVEQGIGKTFKPGEVIVKGKRKVYTEISDSSESQFKDSIVVLKEDIDKAVYTEPASD